MTQAPVASVILVNYNTKDLTLACLESLRRHGVFARHEVIVVDNASSDGGAQAVAERFPEVRLLRERRNHGFGGGCNRGAQAAKGRYLFFLNTDAELTSDAATALADLLDEHPEYVATGCRLVWPDGRRQPSAARFPTPLRIFCGRDVASDAAIKRFPLLRELLSFYYLQEELREVRRVDWCVGAALMVRAKDFFDVGMFDERMFLYGEELELCSRLTQAGGAIAFHPGVVVVHHEAGGGQARLSPSRSARIAAGHRYYYFKRHGPLGGTACVAADLAGSALKGLLWLASALVCPRKRKADRLEKASWHWLYLRRYFSLRY